VLNQIAIESLPFDKESTVSYHYNLTRLSSTRELVNKHNLHPNKSATLYGDLFYRASAETMQQATTRSAVGTLPYSKQEINSISQLLSCKQYHVNKLSQKQGTEASFKSLSGKSPSILHLSTHGFVNRPIEGDAMQRSGLIMAYGARAWEGKAVPKDTEDGILTAAEIATLDLSGTDIVVLSACNTALGEVTTEGVWGLQRAFKQAGAQTIVMSLWQVDDEATAVFMQYFYEALLKGRQTLAKAVSIDTEIAEHIFDYPHDALATAQRRMRQHPQYSSPYYWAGFIVID
jgi:CHAT domain-containing protein